MALEKQVYHLSASARRLPTGAVYARSGSTWARNLGRYIQLTADAPVWGARGLMIEGAETNLMIRSIPNNDAVLTNSGLFLFTTASPLIVGRDVQTHAAKATANRPVRSMAAAPDVSTVTQDIVWAEVEMVDSEMIDIGWTDAVGNWIDCVRFTLATGAATVLYGSPAAAAIVDSTAGLNGGAMVRVAALKANGHWDRFPAIAPAGAFQTHKRSIVHHLQVAQAADVNSPIVTEGSINSRSRASLVSTIEDPGPAQTVAFEFFTGILAGSRRVIWQLDQDSDTTALSLVMEPGGRLLLVCGSAVLDLGKPNAQSVAGLAFNITDTAIRARLNGGAVQTLAISRPRFTRERWGGAKAAGFETGSLELVEVKRWLSMATDAELLAESTPGEAVAGVANVQSSAGAVYAADFSLAQAPGALLENSVVPSSGNARLLEVYAGPGRIVYRKSRSASSRQELSWAGTRRVENLLAAADIHQSSGMGIGGSNVTAIGTATHLGLACDFVTWPALTHSWPTSYVQISPALNLIFPGVVIAGRIDVAVSRDLTPGETIRFAITGSAFTAGKWCSGLKAGRFYSIAINDGLSPSPATGNTAIYAAIADGIVVASPLTIYVRARQLVDSTGLAASETVQPFVDPAVDYGAGCTGVRHFHTVCANTVDATTGEIIEVEGAAISPPPGMRWHPAATSLIADSPPVTPFGELECTIGNSPVSVAGLPAKRITASANANVSRWIGRSIGYLTGVYTLYAVLRKPAGFGSRPAIEFYYSGGANGKRIIISADWTTNDIQGTGVLAHGVVPLGDDCYYVYAVATLEGYATTAFLLLVDETGGAYIGPNEYLDIAAFNCIAGHHEGGPLLTSAGQVARAEDQPRTQLPAIRTGPFTAIVDMTLRSDLWSGNGWIPFTINGSSGCFLYMISSGLFFFKDSETLVGAPGVTLARGQRIKIAFRRKPNGDVAVFTDGVKRVEVASSNYDGNVEPVFGSNSYLPNAIYHSQRLFYSALSDAECEYRTNLGNP